MKTLKRFSLPLSIAGIFIFVFAISTPLLARAQSEMGGTFIDHAGTLLPYDGAATCLECHPEQVATFGSSNHYLWQGKMGAINDFCTYPDINLGPSKLTTVFGTVIDGGCLACHAGLGNKPVGADPLDADCLTCHASQYRRTAAQIDGTWLWVPNYTAMPATITIDPVPTRYACLVCHAYSGGGQNNKRGDISAVLVNPTPENDVHMGSGMVCIDCHVTIDHRIAGQGADMRIDEGTAMRPCRDCHNVMKIHPRAIKRHLDAVACQSCHIPTYARFVSTDMLRDYRAAEVNARGLYEPVITRQSNVIPVYAFWNGQNEFYDFGAPATQGQIMAGPLGDINDGMLYPFRVHTTIMPQDPVSLALLPVKSGILFQTGDINLSILTAAAQAGFTLTQGYTYTNTTRTMGIYHEMPSADQVLQCAGCHDAGGRVDFSALGYDPLTTRNNKPLCVSCHPRRPALDFYALHEQHATGKRLDCLECHTFSRK